MKKIFARTTEIAGTCFSCIAFLCIVSLLQGYNVVLYALLSVCYFGLAYALFAKKREGILPACCYFVAGLLLILTCISAVNHGQYYGRFYSGYGWTFIADLITVLSFTGLALFGASAVSNQFIQHKDTFLKFWYVPTALRGLAVVLQLIFAAQQKYFYYLEGIGILLGGLIAVAAIFFTTVWTLFPERLPEVESDGPEGYIKMVKHILLLFLTFGIWWLIWIYRTTKYLNRADNEEPRKPVTELLLCMFIPFYIVYWNYKSALRIDTLLGQNGMGPKIGNISIFWSIFAFILVPILMQDSINRIALEFENGCNDLPESFYLYDSFDE